MVAQPAAAEQTKLHQQILQGCLKPISRRSGWCICAIHSADREDLRKDIAAGSGNRCRTFAGISEQPVYGLRNIAIGFF
jgi:hypothetical protein